MIYVCLGAGITAAFYEWYIKAKRKKIKHKIKMSCFNSQMWFDEYKNMTF